MNDYKTIRNIAEIEEYIGSAGVVSFDFETSPTENIAAIAKRHWMHIRQTSPACRFP